MNSANSACVFCRLNQLPSPAELFRDGLCFAVPDRTPQAPTHLLVIPSQHLAGMRGMEPRDEELIGHLLLVATALAERFEVSETGYRLVINSGANGGQTVDHLHVHLLGGRQLGWPPG